jgi:tetratricopeptide (TPR) repeat protein
MTSQFQQLNAFAVIACLLTFCAITANAQSSPGSIRGRVVLPSGASLETPVMVRLESLRGVKSHSYTDNQGNFEFPNTPVGLYQIVIEPDKERFEPTTASVEVFPNSPSILTITLREKADAVAAIRPADTISSAELDSQVPAAAKREFDRASVLSKEQKHAEAIIYFRKAIAIYPRYLKAINDLGTQLLAVGNLDEAITEFRRAIAIDAKAFNPHLNLGIVLVQKHEFADASEELRKAISLQANSPTARLYFGIALIGLNDETTAISELKTAYTLGGNSHAVALYHLGQIYFNQNNRAEALKMFEQFLVEQPTGAKAEEVRQLISLLR